VNAKIAISQIITLVAAMFISGCGDTMTNYYRVVSTTAVSAAACRDVLSEAHEKKTADIAEKAKTDKPGAQADLDKWLPIYEKIKTSCVSLKVASKLALVAGPSVEAAVTKKKDAIDWIVRLTKLGFDVVTALTEAGLKLPGGK
jgi:hypothetical protein